MTPNDVISVFVYNNCTVFVLRSGDISISKDRIITNGCAILDRDFTEVNFLSAAKSVFRCEFMEFVRKVSGDVYSGLKKLSALGNLLCQNRLGLPVRGFVCIDDCENKERPSHAIGKSLFCRAIREMGMGQLVPYLDYKDGGFWNIDPCKSPLIAAVGDLESDLALLSQVVCGSAKIFNKCQDVVVTTGSNFPGLLLESNFNSSDFGTISSFYKFFEYLFFYDYFGYDFTPRDYFHHRLFDDWSEYEWSRFDNLMIWSQSTFLKGLASGNFDFYAALAD